MMSIWFDTNFFFLVRLLVAFATQEFIRLCWYFLRGFIEQSKYYKKR